MKTQSHQDAEAFSGIEYAAECAEVIAEAAKTSGRKVRLNDGGFEVEYKPGQWAQFACISHTRWTYPDREENNKALRLASEGLPEQMVLAVNSHAALLEVCKKWADIIQGGDKFSRLEPWAQECVTDIRAAIAQASEVQP